LSTLNDSSQQGDIVAALTYLIRVSDKNQQVIASRVLVPF
jgi:hypothetical protein